MEPATVPEAEKLVASVLTKCHRDVWWRITPDSYGEDDISVGSRQEWVDLLPILIQAGMLRAKYSGNDGQYQLVYSNERLQRLASLRGVPKDDAGVFWLGNIERWSQESDLHVRSNFPGHTLLIKFG